MTAHTTIETCGIGRNKLEEHLGELVSCIEHQVRMHSEMLDHSVDAFAVSLRVDPTINERWEKILRETNCEPDQWREAHLYALCLLAGRGVECFIACLRDVPGDATPADLAVEFRRAWLSGVVGKDVKTP